MARVDFHPVARNLRIEVASDAPALTGAEEHLVEVNWQAECRKRGRSLFNGEMLEFMRLEGDRIVARFVEYRIYLASRAGALGTRQAVTPLGVSGVVCCGDHVGFGRRAAHVTQYPGWLELIPSGSIDRDALRADGTIDHCGQLIRELSEETGLGESAIGEIVTLGLVFDAVDAVYDLCVSITLTENEPSRLGPMRSEEYDDLFFVNRASLPALTRSWDGRIVPTSLAILTGVGWL